MSNSPPGATVESRLNTTSGSAPGGGTYAPAAPPFGAPATPTMPPEPIVEGSPPLGAPPMGAPPIGRIAIPALPPFGAPAGKSEPGAPPLAGDTEGVVDGEGGVVQPGVAGGMSTCDGSP